MTADEDGFASVSYMARFRLVRQHHRATTTEAKATKGELAGSGTGGGATVRV